MRDFDRDRDVDRDRDRGRDPDWNAKPEIWGHEKKKKN
jgi:hypothetical protein